MYRAKRSGADRIEIFNAEMRSDKDGRLALEGELRDASREEAAASSSTSRSSIFRPRRWRASRRCCAGSIRAWARSIRRTSCRWPKSPTLSSSSGRIALSRAVREAQRWQRELPRADQPLFVSVNVSSRQLFRPELINEVRHILGRAVIPKGSLRLEITGMAGDGEPRAGHRGAGAACRRRRGTVARRFRHGLFVALLSQPVFLRHHQDRLAPSSRRSGQNGTGAVVLRSIVALAHELGKKVVAEGVEAEDDVAFLRSIGCEYGQGFYYGEPMSERDVLQLLKVVRRAERRMKKSVLFRQRARARAEVAAMPTPSPAPAVNGPATAPTVRNGFAPPGSKPPGPMPPQRRPGPPRPPVTVVAANGSGSVAPPRLPGGPPPALPAAPQPGFQPSPLRLAPEEARAPPPRRLPEGGPVLSLPMAEPGWHQGHPQFRPGSVPPPVSNRHLHHAPPVHPLRCGRLCREDRDRTCPSCLPPSGRVWPSWRGTDRPRTRIRRGRQRARPAS